MDKKTGFKECPRCGLRNKPTAKQCDFCGQKFDISDDWEQQIDALEKLTKQNRKVEVSEDMSRRIEATIVTKEMVEKEEAPKPKVVVVAKPEPAKVEFVPPPQIEEPVRPEPVVAAPVPPEPKPEPIVVKRPEPAPEPFKAESIEIEVPEPKPEEEVVQPIVAEPAEGPVVVTVKKKERRRKPKHLPSTKFFRWGVSAKDRTSLVFAGLLVLGIVAYLVAIVMEGSLGEVVSWGFVVVSGMLIVMGFSQVAINWEVADEPMRVDIPGTADDEIVEICPSCHERVSPDCDRCPACGTEFEPSDDH
ncbi:MAG: Double zinc ribbon [Methanomassiliicoccales archaeon PtaU1.Bin124]|nr:MAG: Double zinc ribbon [Methanomassiliicoccales archaeon PtaU1.Bin124]